MTTTTPWAEPGVGDSDVLGDDLCRKKRPNAEITEETSQGSGNPVDDRSMTCEQNKLVQRCKALCISPSKSPDGEMKEVLNRVGADGVEHCFQLDNPP